ncbi:MAG: hypothetical protein GX116_00060, partial [Fibrobacter sp.]|nr:hypothetical protein [Fibrobacter sp.]
LTLDEKAKGAFLRENGLTDAHITLWTKEFIDSQSPAKTKKEKNEIQLLKNNIRALKKDLKRKNAALAATLALHSFFKKSMSTSFSPISL